MNDQLASDADAGKEIRVKPLCFPGSLFYLLVIFQRSRLMRII